MVEPCEWRALPVALGPRRAPRRCRVVGDAFVEERQRYVDAHFVGLGVERDGARGARLAVDVDHRRGGALPPQDGDAVGQVVVIEGEGVAHPHRHVGQVGHADGEPQRVSAPVVGDVAVAQVDGVVVRRVVTLGIVDQVRPRRRRVRLGHQRQPLRRTELHGIVAHRPRRDAELGRIFVLVPVRAAVVVTGLVARARPAFVAGLGRRPVVGDAQRVVPSVVAHQQRRRQDDHGEHGRHGPHDPPTHPESARPVVHVGEDIGLGGGSGPLSMQNEPPW